MTQRARERAAKTWHAAQTDTMQRGLAAYESRHWAQAHDQLSLADAEQPLAASDLERLATAAYLAGRDEASSAAWLRAHQAYLSRGDAGGAVRCAFCLARGLLERGDAARGGAWITRAGRLLEEAEHRGVEEGYLIWAAGYQYITAGDAIRAADSFERALALAERFGDRDLLAMARHGHGRALIRAGDVKRGVAALDAAMVAVDAGELSPMVAGEVYCSVIAGCMEVFDLRRAKEWTAALSRWCESQPELVPYRGECLVRRAELMQLQGAWSDAIEAATRACKQCRDESDTAIAGSAWYQLAELHRLGGAYRAAEKAYRQASRLGRRVQPGLALLRRAAGRVDAAAVAIRQALDETEERRVRVRLLPASVEILLACGEVEGARAAAAELATMAEETGATLLHALAAHTRGAVLLHEREMSGAITALRSACACWQELDVPYDLARARAMLAVAYRALGDEDGAALELDAARWTFERLGAAPDLVLVTRLSDATAPNRPGVLTPRETEVLRLVATGRTNRVIAGDLSISDRTVARHVANIFTKLSLPSRAAATAFAYEHGLVHASDGEHAAARRQPPT